MEARSKRPGWELCASSSSSYPARRAPRHAPWRAGSTRRSPAWASRRRPDSHTRATRFVRWAPLAWPPSASIDTSTSGSAVGRAAARQSISTKSTRQCSLRRRRTHFTVGRCHASTWRMRVWSWQLLDCPTPWTCGLASCAWTPPLRSEAPAGLSSSCSPYLRVGMLFTCIDLGMLRACWRRFACRVSDGIHGCSEAVTQLVVYR